MEMILVTMDASLVFKFNRIGGYLFLQPSSGGRCTNNGVPVYTRAHFSWYQQWGLQEREKMNKCSFKIALVMLWYRCTVFPCRWGSDCSRFQPNLVLWIHLATIDMYTAAQGPITFFRRMTMTETFCDEGSACFPFRVAVNICIDCYMTRLCRYVWTYPEDSAWIAWPVSVQNIFPSSFWQFPFWACTSVKRPQRRFFSKLETIYAIEGRHSGIWCLLPGRGLGTFGSSINVRRPKMPTYSMGLSWWAYAVDGITATQDCAATPSRITAMCDGNHEYESLMKASTSRRWYFSK